MQGQACHVLTPDLKSGQQLQDMEFHVQQILTKYGQYKSKHIFKKFHILVPNKCNEIIC
jgi:hypothetical protein